MMLLTRLTVQIMPCTWFSKKINAVLILHSSLTSLWAILHIMAPAWIHLMMKILFPASWTKKSKFNVLEIMRIIPSTLLMVMILMLQPLSWNLIHTQSLWFAFSFSKLFSAQWFASGPIIKLRNNNNSPLECKRTSIHFSTRFINSYQRRNRLECTTSMRDRLWEELLAKVKEDEGK